FHLDFRATERERQSIKRFGARQCDSGVAQKFVKRRMRKLRCQFDRGKIAAANQRIARANRPKKFVIEIFRIVIAETARRVCQDRQWMNQHLVECERVDERFERGTGRAWNPSYVHMSLNLGDEEKRGSMLTARMNCHMMSIDLG